MKEERLSPPPQRVKEERLSPPLSNAIATNARGRILHYLGSDEGGNNCLSSRSAMTAQEYAYREQHRMDRRNMACRSKLADSNATPPHIATGP